MAGVYSDDERHRIAYDIDGSKVYYLDETEISNGTAAPVLLTSEEISALNDDKNNTSYQITLSSNTSQYRSLLIIFPKGYQYPAYRFRTIPSATIPESSYLYFNVEYATDPVTTNGINNMSGGGSAGNYVYNYPYYYRNTSMSYLNTYSNEVRGIKFSFSPQSSDQYGAVVNISHLSVYATPIQDNRLVFWSADTNAIAGPSYFDFGTTALETSSTKTFRVKNVSAVTATNIVLSKNVLAAQEYAPVPFFDQFKFSLDNSTWSDTLAVPDLAAGATSSTIYLRRITPSNALQTPYDLRLIINSSLT